MQLLRTPVRRSCFGASRAAAEDPQGSLWDQLLPPQVRTLSTELTTIDKCLADERFFEPYLQLFRTVLGRPRVPVET